MFGPVRADQSDQTGLFRRRAFKRQEVRQSVQTEGEWRTV